MIRICVPEQFRALNFGGAECFRKLDLSAPPQGEEVVLDLSGVTFIDPIGLASLWAWKAEAQGVAGKFSVVMPHSPDVRKYLDVMGFFDNVPYPRGVQTSMIGSGIYLPIHQLHPGPGVVETLASDLATTFCDDEPGAINALGYCFGEAIENVFQHAKSPVGAVASAQLLPKTPRRWCQASIADRGMGVLQSLRGSPEHAGLGSDEEAMRSAIQRLVTSSKPYVGMYGRSRPGMGLFMISEVCRRTDGELMLMSGNCILRVHKYGEAVETVPRWPGTVLTVRLSANALGNVLPEIWASLRGDAPADIGRFED